MNFLLVVKNMEIIVDWKRNCYSGLRHNSFCLITGGCSLNSVQVNRGKKVPQEWQPQVWHSIYWGQGIGPHCDGCGGGKFVVKCGVKGVL